MSARRSRCWSFSGLALCLALPAALVASLPPPSAAPGPASPCPDADGDTYADCLVPGCAPDGLACGDCNDASPLIHPGATETCNHVADACAGVDQGFPQVTSIERVVDRHAAAYDHFALAAISLGDVSGDGVPDFAVGNPMDDLGTTDGGSVTLYSGADRSVLCRQFMATSYDHLGTTLAPAGDLDADGLPDLAAGAPGADFILLVSGAGCGEIGRCVDPTGEANQLGDTHGLAAVVDITGDGLPELVAGAITTNVPVHHGGKAIVFSPGPGGVCSVLFTLSDPEITIYANLGFAAAGLDDVNGDGVADIAVGEPGDDHTAASAGSVLIFSGADGSLLARRLDPLGAANNRFGEALAAVPDMNGDMVGDLIVGAPRRSTSFGTHAGEVVVLSGVDGAVLTRLHDPDGKDSDWFGAAVAVLPDVDGDRLPEIVVGAPRADRIGAADAGRAIVLSGADGSRIRTLDDPTGSAGDQLGYAVAGAGDLSLDAVPEILAGAPYRENGSVLEAGRLVVFSLESDCDGDGLGPFGGDCNEVDGGLWRAPSEVLNLAVVASPGLVTWDPPAEPGNASGLLSYDTLRASSPGGLPDALCLETSGADLSTPDGELPPVGGVYFYLVRACNLCGPGSPGRDSAGDPRAAPVCP